MTRADTPSFAFMPHSSLRGEDVRGEYASTRIAGETIGALADRLARLRVASAPAALRARELDEIYSTVKRFVSESLPALAGLPLPLPRKTRQMIRTLQDILDSLAETLCCGLPDSTVPAASGPAVVNGDDH